MTYLQKGKYVITLVLLLILLQGCQGNANQAAEDNTETQVPSASPVAPTNSPDHSGPTDSSVAATVPTETGKGSTPSSAVPADLQMGKVTALRLIDPKSGWIGGEGWIARSDDGGKKWNKQFTSSGVISQLFALNGQQAWAVVSPYSGSDNTHELLSTADGGKHWTSAGKLPNMGFVHFVSAKEAFSGNAITTDGGKTWTKLAIPENTVGDAYFHDKNHGWAVTAVNDTFEVKATINGGGKWQTVMSRKSVGLLSEAIIRSGGTDDAWIECIGGSGMTQTSYSLFHTADGGKNWRTVIAHSTAGAGPAPGFPLGYTDGPNNKGSKPGPLYVVNPNVAFMGGECPACDKQNSIGWTKDGGKTWINGKAEFPGYGDALLAFANANQGWWICTDNSEPSVLYTTADGGKTWTPMHTFDRPKLTS